MLSSKGKRVRPDLKAAVDANRDNLALKSESMKFSRGILLECTKAYQYKLNLLGGAIRSMKCMSWRSSCYILDKSSYIKWRTNLILTFPLVNVQIALAHCLRFRAM